MKLTRFVSIATTAATTTMSLFYLMHGMVASDEIILPEPETRVIIDWVQEPVSPPVITERDRLIKPEPIIIPDPVDQDIPPTVTSDIRTIGIPPVAPPGDDLGHDFSNLAIADGERIPVVRVTPQFPRRCAERGLSGWVVVEFEVSPHGTVENPTVIGSDDTECFNRAALKAISRFKYKPDIVGGEPQRATGVRFRMSFAMDT